MPTIRVMSWNIESLGDAKATVIDPIIHAIGESEIVTFINLVIRQIDADIVSIMEVKSGIGAQLLGWLLPRLNNGAGAGVQWLGRVSARQDGGTQEETLYLWRERPGILRLDPAGLPAPISSMGIVDKNLMETTFASRGISNNPAKQDAFIDALANIGYVVNGTYTGPRNKRLKTRTWRVNSNQWNTLNTMPPPAQVNLTLNPPLTTAQKQVIAAQLLGADILRFVSYADRSPFVANFLVGNPAKRVMVAVLHAAGPQDKVRTDAINVIGLSNAAAAAANLLLMGDFNIGANQGGLTGVEYGRFMRTGEFVFAQLVPRQYQQVFFPVENAPLHAGNWPLTPDPRTTMIKRWVDDTAPLSSVLANTFDKVFLRSNANPAQAMTGGSPLAWNMIAHLDPAQAMYWQQAARSALIYFRAFRGDAHLQDADAVLAKKEAKEQKTFTMASNQAAKTHAKIAAMHPPPPLNSQLFTRLADYNTKATKAAQERAAAHLQRAAIVFVRALINGAGTDPTGVGTALAIYRQAISDHFPISTDLTA
jgi:hypothetical protein